MKSAWFFIVFSTAVYADDIFTNQFEALVTTRISTLALKDPHIFADLPFFGCTDITDTTPLGDGINPMINASIVADRNGDGFLDLSFITRHNTDQPNYLISRPTMAVLSEGDCTDTLTCEVTPAATETIFITATQATSGTCLDVEPGTTRPYASVIQTPAAPCYVTDIQDVTLNLNGIILILNEFQQALRYQGGMVTDQGLLKGFLTATTAESIILPNDIPEIGGNTLASVLRGHPDNCSNDSDMDVHPTLGDGWWMYFNTTADLVLLETN